MPSNERANRTGLFEQKKRFNTNLSNDMAQEALREITEVISQGREATISSLLEQSIRKIRRHPDQSSDQLRLGLIQLEKQFSQDAESVLSQGKEIVLPRMQNILEEFNKNRERITKEFSFQIVYSDILITQSDLDRAFRQTSIERTLDYRRGKSLAESALRKLIRSAEHAGTLCDRNYGAQIFFEQMATQLKLTEQVGNAYFIEAILAIKRAEILRTEIIKLGQ